MSRTGEFLCRSASDFWRSYQSPKDLTKPLPGFLIFLVRARATTSSLCLLIQIRSLKQLVRLDLYLPLLHTIPQGSCRTRYSQRKPRSSVLVSAVHGMDLRYHVFHHSVLQRIRCLYTSILGVGLLCQLHHSSSCRNLHSWISDISMANGSSNGFYAADRDQPEQRSNKGPVEH